MPITITSEMAISRSGAIQSSSSGIQSRAITRSNSEALMMPMMVMMAGDDACQNARQSAPRRPSSLLALRLTKTYHASVASRVKKPMRMISHS